jgi:hypothetical protein
LLTIALKTKLFDRLIGGEAIAWLVAIALSLDI